MRPMKEDTSLCVRSQDVLLSPPQKKSCLTPHSHPFCLHSFVADRHLHQHTPTHSASMSSAARHVMAASLLMIWRAVRLPSATAACMAACSARLSSIRHRCARHVGYGGMWSDVNLYDVMLNAVLLWNGMIVYVTAYHTHSLTHSIISS